MLRSSLGSILGSPKAVSGPQSKLGQVGSAKGRINLICIGVHDMARSLKFFRDLGFQTGTDEVIPPIVFFNNEGSKLELFPLAELAQDINPDNPPALPEQWLPRNRSECFGVGMRGTLWTRTGIIGTWPTGLTGNSTSRICW